MEKPVYRPNTSVPCASGFYLDEESGCQPCDEGTYSEGQFATVCSACPPHKTVESGQGVSEQDCSWSKFFIVI